MIENNSVLPIWWPFRLSIETFKATTFPKELCKEIHEFLSIENNRNGFIDYLIKPLYSIYHAGRYRDINIYLSLFGVKDKLYTSEIMEKYDLSRERVRQIMGGMTRSLFHYVRDFTDIRFSTSPTHMPYLNKLIQ
jgi:hypothetical protein